MHKVFLAIGSNLGNKKKNCLVAVEKLKETGIIIEKISKIYITEPWGIKEQPVFANMVISGFTEASPFELLKSIKNIEKEMGREKTIRYGPRIIDIDIIFYDNLILETEHLTIPHPLAHKRYFVLRPLIDIAPDFIHPVLKVKVKKLLDNL